ncbi:MAG: hypothetical protein ACI90V_007006 [Bacillariaceae sp.]|jgi:hypothetical protein
MSLLSADILHQVFKFFVSQKTNTVDGESIINLTQVCKQWKTVVDSKSLWAAPAAGGVHGIYANCCLYSVHRSLQMKEEINPISNGKSLHASLMGFVKIKFYGGNYPELYFFVRERATGHKLLLSINRDEQKRRSLIRELYVNHFELKDKFLLKEGISIWKGRVVQYYPLRTETEAKSMINKISAKRQHSSQNCEAFIQHGDSFNLVSHLIDLEGVWGMDYGRFYIQGRQHVVDWMAEIAECFDLEDRIIFQAMLLFDRFIASNDLVSFIYLFLLSFVSFFIYLFYATHKNLNSLMVISMAESE